MNSKYDQGIYVIYSQIWDLWCKVPDQAWYQIRNQIRRKVWDLTNFELS